MCTADVCTDKGCVHTPITDCCLSVDDCNDENVCTDDGCDDANLCAHPVPDPTCQPCVGGDPFECGPRCLNACQDGKCAEVVTNCDDNDTCTIDVCDASVGCTHTTNTSDENCVTEPPPTCTPAGCNDNDACTTDECNAANTACAPHEQKTGLDSLYCRLDAMKATLDAASGDQVSEKLRKRANATLTKVRAKIDKAKAAPKCKKQRNLIGSIRGPLKKLLRQLNKGAGKQINADVATTLVNRTGELLGKVDEVRANLGC
jgi:hypothetical protein